MSAENSRRASGLANAKGAKITIEKDAAHKNELKLILTRKVASKVNKPSKSVVRTTLKPGFKKAHKALIATVGNDLYRADLKKIALGAFTSASGVAKASRHGFKAKVSLGRKGNKLGKRVLLSA